jgi:hypothetical protein
MSQQPVKSQIALRRYVFKLDGISLAPTIEPLACKRAFFAARSFIHCGTSGGKLKISMFRAPLGKNLLNRLVGAHIQ